MELKGKKVNFLGDSITEGVGTSCEAAMFPNIIAKEAELAVARNYGVSGSRIARQKLAEGEGRDPRDYCERFEEMDDDADIVIVFGGTNDYGHGNADFGGDSDRTPDTYCGAVHYLMEGLLNKYPTADIVFLTPIHRDGETIRNMHGRVLKEYVDEIRVAAEQYSIPVLDLFASGGIYPQFEGQKKALCPDGLHPNDAGNLKIARRIISFLKTL
ncbi:MAG: SGNH/GDSL hydrolase family protein [Clostridia bacterium]|nr:SGNH/GDSL hydrolase family protein [Clostridia bacterium]